MFFSAQYAASRCGDPAPGAVPGEAWIALIGFGVFSAFAVAAFLGGSRRVGAARAALVSTIEPVYTIVMATILLGESLDPIQVLGGGLVVVGVLLTLGGKLPWLGRLPGDIVIQRDHFTFYFPLATSILLSVVLSLLFMLFRR